MNMECQKQILKLIWNTLKYSGDMKLKMKFYLFLHNFSKLWNVYFRVPMGKCLQCYFRQLFISSTFKGSNVLKVILVQGFRPLKTENVQFPLRYRLKSWSVLLMLTYLAGQYWRKHPMIFNEYTRTASAFMSRNRNKTLQRRNQLAVHITMTTIL